MTVTIDLITTEVQGTSPRDIAATIAMLVRTGELPAGTRLPTVRALGGALGVSPATVSHAWQALARAGLVVSRGRGGTVVLEPPTPVLTGHSRGLAARAVAAQDVPVRLDLSAGLPDPLLLPDVRPAFDRVAPPRATVTSYLQPPMLPELEAFLRQSWPYSAPAFTMVDGAMDATQRVLAEVARFGDRVVVEEPGFPLLLDLLDHMNLTAVQARVDAQGMNPEALERALEARPVAVVLQPRAHNPTGASVTRSRADELRAVLARHPHGGDVVVIEDDHSGSVATAAAVSIGEHLPERTVRILGFSKSHGPDLRIAALSGPAEVIERVVAHRMLGPGWTSHLVQSVLLDLLTQEAPAHQVRRARHAYYIRQRELASALAAHGVTVRQADGLNMWLPVIDEERTQLRLAAHGIRVARGSAFHTGGHRAARPENGSTSADRQVGGHHVRVSVGMLRESIAAVAATLARAAD